MVINFLFITIFLMLQLVCTSLKGQEIRLPVTIEKCAFGKLKNVKNTHLTIRNEDDSKTLLFGLNRSGEFEEVSGYDVKIYSNDKTRILISSINSNYIEEKYFIYKSSKIKVLKYFYDDPSSIDEECYFFIADDKLVYVSSIVYNSDIFYRYDELDLYKNIISETGSFFNNK